MVVEGAKMERTDMLACKAERPTMTEQLRQRKVSLEADLAEVNAALEALERHPEITRVLDTVAKAVGRQTGY